MKKIKYSLIIFIALFIVFPVKAATITKTTYDGNIKIEGSGTGQIQLVLFDKNNEPIYMTTVMASNNKFSTTLPKIDGLVDGNYKVKVADYDGSHIDDEVVAVKIASAQNPQTSDKIIIFIIITFVGIVGVIGTLALIKKKVNK